MARKQKPQEFPDLTCSACRFCLGQRDQWECWGDLPRHLEPDEIGQSRGEPINPMWPVCYFFVARENG